MAAKSLFLSRQKQEGAGNSADSTSSYVRQLAPEMKAGIRQGRKPSTINPPSWIHVTSPEQGTGLPSCRQSLAGAVRHQDKPLPLRMPAVAGGGTRRSGPWGWAAGSGHLGSSNIEGPMCVFLCYLSTRQECIRLITALVLLGFQGARRGILGHTAHPTTR